MGATTRTFTVDELNELDATAHGDAVVRDELVDTRRWYEIRRAVLRLGGQLWAIEYRDPLTELSEVEPFDGDTVTATLMESYEVTVTRYRAVDA